MSRGMTDNGAHITPARVPGAEALPFETRQPPTSLRIDRLCRSGLGRGLSSAVVLAALCAGVAGCSGPSTTKWIEAPLLADAEVDVTRSGQSIGAYSGFASELNLGGSPTSAQQLALWRFSLASLPNSGSPGLMMDSSRAVHEAAGNYALDASKVVHARLVVYVDTAPATPAGLDICQWVLPGTSTPLPAWPNESVPPALSNFEQCFGGMDADNPSKILVIKDRGFYSFDVTAAVKAAISAGENEVTLNAASGQALQIASKEGSNGGQNHLEHAAHLLIDLTDAVGIAGRLTQTQAIASPTPCTTVVGAPAGSVPLCAGTQNATMLMNLDSFKTPQVLTTPFHFDSGTAGLVINGFNGGNQTNLQAVFTGQINAAINLSATAGGARPQLWITDLSVLGQSSEAGATWSSLQTTLGGSQPPFPLTSAAASTPVAFGSSVVNQVAVLDDSQNLAQQMTLSSGDYTWAALSTNLANTLSFSGASSLHPPRMAAAMTVGSGNLIDIDTDDNSSPVLGVSSSNDPHAGYDYYSTQAQAGLVLKARIGQWFTMFWLEALGSSSGYMVMPIAVSVPTSGASALLQTDFEPADIFSSHWGSSLNAPDYWKLGYQVFSRANDIVGTYSASASMPGHNSRLTLQFTNEPLPQPSLSGPASVTIPAGQTSLTWSATQAPPYALTVWDSYGVNDATTNWDFSSDGAGDSIAVNGIMIAPQLAQFTQTPGTSAPTQNLAVMFGSVGNRILTVKSHGDTTGTAQAALNVAVYQDTATALSGPTSTIVGQPAAFAAAFVLPPNVKGKVSFCLDATNTAPTTPGGLPCDNNQSGEVLCYLSASAAAPATCAANNLAIGTHTITAYFSGGSFVNPSASNAVTVTVQPAPAPGQCGPSANQTLLTAPATGLCTGGSAGPVSFANHRWTWTCNGINGSTTNATCSAGIQNYTVTSLVSGSGGSVAPSSSVADYNTTASFTASPNLGYALSGLSGCGATATGNTITTAPVTGTCTITVTFSANPINGTCGSDSGKTLVSAPTNLCSSGAPGAIAGNGPWSWTCNGANGGTNASCSATLAAATQAPLITSGNAAHLVVTSSGTITVTTSGSPTPAISETGTLPAGLTFIDAGNGTATLSGTPAPGTVGSYALTISASNGVSPTATQSFTLSIDKKSTTVSLTATPNPATEGRTVAFTATVAGDPPTGTVTFSDNGTSLPCSPVTLTSGTTSSTAVCTANLTNTGMHMITASYAGDANFAPVASPALAVTVNAGVSATSAVPVPLLDRAALLLLGVLIGFAVFARSRMV